MSLECSSCERDLRGEHDPDCKWAGENPRMDPHAALDRRALDAAVAEKVMGEKVWCHPITRIWRMGDNSYRADKSIPAYTSWDAAGQVVERLKELGYVVKMEAWPEAWYWAYVGREDEAPWEAAEPESMPLAICRAALAALAAEDVPAAIHSGCCCPAGSYTKGDRHEPYCPAASTTREEQG